jgi:hypothetical protein
MTNALVTYSSDLLIFVASISASENQAKRGDEAKRNHVEL